MKMHSIKASLFAGAFALFLASCSKQVGPVSSVNTLSTVKATTTQATTTTLLSETFETGSKTSYAVGSVSLSSGSWTLDDALIGNLTSDLKSGTQSVRIRNTGTLTNNFDIAGSTTNMALSVKHGIYGTDAASTWQLFISTDKGNSFTQVGSTVTSTTTLQTATFTIPASNTLRISIRKISGGTNRINIDDIILTTGSAVTDTTPTVVVGDDNNMLLGNPSGATTSTSNLTNYLMDQTYYIESYNSQAGKPNWVSWHVQASDLGTVARTNTFAANTSLPSGWYQVGPSSYTGSGFDRGHNCPSGDRTATTAANQATFLMTNMMPQAPNNNQVTWEGLESYTRSLVTTNNSEVFIIAGSYGQGGSGSNGGTTTTIDNRHVVVPAFTWKVVVVLPNGKNDLQRITTSTRVISVIMPNTNGLNSDWKTYRTSLAAIQNVTGYNLLSNVPASVKNALLNVVDAL